jgi:CheY-like chemotaxis protein
LQDEGFEVETVSNGVAAIKKLPTMQPLLVLADVSMPGKDGYEVCDYVKTSAALRHVPVVLVASDLEPYDELRGTQVRADGIIKKPFSPDDLISMVAKFAALGEAPAAPPALPETLVTPSPVVPPEFFPMGPEAEGAPGRYAPDLAAPSAGMPFAEPSEIRAMPPEPTLEPGLELAMEPTPPAPESISRTGVEAMPEPTLIAPGPALEPIAEAAPEVVSAGREAIPEAFEEFAPEPTLVAPEPAPEPIAEAAPEVVSVGPEAIPEAFEEFAPEPTLAAPEPAREPTAEAAPEVVSVGPEAIPEAFEEFAPEPTQVAPEPAAEPIAEAAPGVVSTGPEAISETAPEATSELASVASEPPVAGSGVPCAPVSVSAATEIAGPMLIDDLAAAAPAPEPPPFVEGQQPKPVAATSQVYAAPPEAEVAPSPEAGVVRPGEGAESPPSVISREWVYVVVYKVVTKMAPPVLPPDLIAELIRVLTEEITAELNSESSQAY